MSEPMQTQGQKKYGIRQKYSDGLIKRAIDLWQPVSDKPITRDDAIAMIDNLVNAFRPLLIAKAKKRRGKEKSSKRRKDTER